MMLDARGCLRKWTGVVAVIAGSIAPVAYPFPAQAWFNLYHGGFGNDSGSGVAIDSSGNVIVAGYRATQAPPVQNDKEGLNAYLRKYSNTGVFLCEIEVKGPSTFTYPNERNSQDTFSGVAVDSQDNIIVVGAISGDYYNWSQNYWTGMYLNKYKPDCSPFWSQPIIYKYPGDSAWQSANSVVVDSSGSIFPTGSVFAGWGGPETEWATWKYDANGGLQSGFPIFYNHSSDFNFSDISYDLALDSLGNIVVVGYRGVSWTGDAATKNLDWHVRKYNPTGGLLWSDTYATSANLYEIAVRVAVDSQNRPVVAGYLNKGSNNTSNADFDWLVMKYAADGVDGQGQRLWTQTYESAPGSSESLAGIAADPDGNVLVAGTVKNDATTFHGVVALLDVTTGIPLASWDVPGPANIAPQRLVYRDGALAVAGYLSSATSPYSDMYVALMDLDYDVRPDPFTLADQADVALSSSIESDTITVSGVDLGAAVSVAGGEYSVDGGDYVSAPGIVNAGQTVRVRLTSSAAYSTTLEATLTIGGVSDTFSVRTMPDPPPVTTADPKGGFFNKPFAVTLSTSEPATVYYTTNGATPTTASKKYAKAIPVAANTTLKFFGVDTAQNVEDVKTETYAFDKLAPKDGTIRIQPGTSAFKLSWDGFSDNLNGSGLKGYKLVIGTKSSSSCSAGIDVGTDTTYEDGDLPAIGKTKYYRVCAVDSVGNVSKGATASQKVLEEYDPPTGGTLAILGTPGEAMTRTTKVALTVSAEDGDNHGPLMVCVSNDLEPCRRWTGLKTPMPWTIPWTLAAKDGERKVNVWFRDALGNATTTPLSRTIILDRVAPRDGTLHIAPTADYFDLSWDEATDANGIKRYRLVGGNRGVPQCGSLKDLLYEGTERTYRDVALPPLGKTPVTRSYRVCAIDPVDNVSKGATASQRILPEYNPPVDGSVVIVAKEPYVDGDDTYTRFADVKLELFATDPDGNGPLKICISNSDVLPCTKWVAYPSSNPPTMPWKLSAGSGEKHVYVRFQDKYGNTGALVSDSVFLDTTKPTDGELAIVQEGTAFELYWSEASDALSGVGGYRLVGKQGSYPGCGDEKYIIMNSIMNTTCRHSGLTAGQTWYYRVCAFDKAGNYSTGAKAFKKVVPAQP